MILKPNLRTAHNVKICFCILVVFFLFCLWELLPSSVFTVGRVIDALENLAVVMLVSGWVLAEIRKVFSVELNDQGVSALVWELKFLLFPVKLVPIAIRWEDVLRVGRNGLSIAIESNEKRITINTYVFDDPNQVISFVESRCEK